MSDALGAVGAVGLAMTGSGLTGHVDLSGAAQSPAFGMADPQAITGQMTDGLRDLIGQNEAVNKVVSSEFGEAMAREQARTAGLPGLTTGPAQAALPGPAESFPGFSREAQALEARLYHLQDKMVIESNMMTVFQIESGMLHQISEQLSQAVNTLVRAS